MRLLVTFFSVLLLFSCSPKKDMPGTSGDIWIHAGYVLTNAGVLKNQYVNITADGLIGEITSEKPENAETVFEAQDAVLTPGFINAHDHLDYNHKGPSNRTMPGYIEKNPDRYNHRFDWRSGCRGYKRMPASKTVVYDYLVWNELRQVVSGTTTIVSGGTKTLIRGSKSVPASGGVDGLARNIGGGPGSEGLVFKKAIELDTFPLNGKRTRCRIQPSSGDGYQDHPDKDEIRDVIYIAHVAEGKDNVSRNEFVNLSSDDGRRVDILGKNVAFIHMVAVLEKDVAKFADAGATMIWSPRSNFSLYGVTAPISLFKEYGVNIVLGTDWAYSGSAHLLDEMKVVSDYNRKYLGNLFTNKEIWQMVTVNPAKFMLLDDQIGDIAPGMQADLALFSLNGRKIETDEEAYGAVVNASQDQAELVMRGGNILFGNYELLKDKISEVESDIDTINGKTYYFGTAIETGRPFDQLKVKNKRTYPLFPDLSKAKTPLDYPVSLENHLFPGATKYSGVLSPQDTDGDGIAEAQDNVRGIFNPVRPVDLTDNGGEQMEVFRKKNPKKTVAPLLKQ